MPIVISMLFVALRIFLIANIVGLVTRVLVAYGITVYLVQPAVDAVIGVLQGKFNVMPAQVALWIEYFNIDVYVGLILSAYSIQSGANYILRVNR